MFLLGVVAWSPRGVLADGEGGIAAAFTSVEVSAGDSGYKFSFSFHENGGLKEISGGWEGKKFAFDGKSLGDISKIYVRGLKFAAPISHSQGKQRHVIVVLPFNVQRVVKGDEEWRHSDVVRIHFDEGDLVSWEKATADPKDPTKWLLSSWEKGGEVTEEGTATTKGNPYAVFEFNDESP